MAVLSGRAKSLRNRPWRGRPRPSSKFASGSRSTATCRPSSDPSVSRRSGVGRLTAIVLGAAAGGGFPQWNCRCPVCRLAWEGDGRVKPSTQASVAVSAVGAHWVLLNASPDLRAQLAATHALHPRDGLRDSPMAAVVLTGAEIDQIAGLLNLRERQKFALYGATECLAAVMANPMFDALAPDVVPRHAVVPDTPFQPAPGLTAELFTVPGKVPLYLERG